MVTLIKGQERIAAALGVAPKTIVEWQAAGFPIARRGGRGVPSEYDLAACRQWLEKHAANKSPYSRWREIPADPSAPVHTSALTSEEAPARGAADPQPAHPAPSQLTLALLALAAAIERHGVQIEDMRDSVDELSRKILGPDDRRNGAALLPLVAEMYGTREVTSADLVQLAMNDRTTACEALRELVLARTTDAGGARALGKFLRRIDGVPLSGYRLLRVGTDRTGVRWRVARVSRAD